MYPSRTLAASRRRGRRPGSPGAARLTRASAEAVDGVKRSPTGPSVSSPRSGSLDAGDRPELPAHADEARHVRIGRERGLRGRFAKRWRVKLESAIWWPSGHERWESTETPDEIFELARAAGEDVSDGRVDLEFIDVQAADAAAIAPWLRLLGVDSDLDGEYLLRAALERAPDVTVADSFGLGRPTTSVVVPFVRFSTVEGRLALSVRRVCVLASESALVRMWGRVAVVGDESAAIDPSTIGHGGTDTLQSVADPETGNAFPSVIRRQRDVPPLDGLVDEVQAGAESVRRAATALGDAVLSWHGRFYSGGALVGQLAEGDAAVLGVLGEAAQQLVRARRSLVQLVERAERRIRGFDTLLPDSLLGVHDAHLLPPLNDAASALIDADTRLAEAREELRDAASLIASTAATTLLRVQQSEASRTASFERRVSILAGVITGPAVIAGIAGANIDFWPLPSNGATLARGSLFVLVGLAVVTGVMTYRYLRP